MSNAKVLTVALDPSLDRTIVTQHLATGYQNLASEPTRVDPGGHAVNVARALHPLGTPTQTIVLLGDDATGTAYAALISEEEFPTTIVHGSGPTRGVTIILDTGNQNETLILEENRDYTESEMGRVSAALVHSINPGDVVVLAGHLPADAPVDTYARLIDIAHRLEGEVVLAAGGEPLRTALATGPDLIAISQIMVEGYFNYPVRSREDILGAARRLRAEGAQRVLIIFSDDRQFVLVTQTGEWIVMLPADSPGTTSGVWDAMLAGYIAGRLSDLSIDEALYQGASAAAYAAAQVGNRFGTLDEVRPYRTAVSVTAYANTLQSE